MSMLTSDLQAGPGQGFQFPGEFEISAMGAADAGLDASVPAALAAAGLRPIADSLQCRPSRQGHYVAVRLRFHADSREQYEHAHAVLRELPGVKWTL